MSFQLVGLCFVLIDVLAQPSTPLPPAILTPSAASPTPVKTVDLSKIRDIRKQQIARKSQQFAVLPSPAKATTPIPPLPRFMNLRRASGSAESSTPAPPRLAALSQAPTPSQSAPPSIALSAATSEAHTLEPAMSSSSAPATPAPAQQPLKLVLPRRSVVKAAGPPPPPEPIILKLPPLPRTFTVGRGTVATNQTRATISAPSTSSAPSSSSKLSIETSAETVHDEGSSPPSPTETTEATEEEECLSLVYPSSSTPEDSPDVEVRVGYSCLLQ